MCTQISEPKIAEKTPELEKFYEDWCSFVEREQGKYIAKHRPYQSSVWEVMTPYEREQVETFTRKLNHHIRELSISWWKERGYTQVYSEDFKMFLLYGPSDL